MWPARYFANSYFAPRYWAEAGAAAPVYTWDSFIWEEWDTFAYEQWDTFYWGRVRGRVVAGDIFVPGAVAGEVFASGAVAGEVN